MLIRFVSPNDFEAWWSLWEGYNSFYKRTVSDEISQNTWQRFLDQNEPVYALVAEVDGTVVGFATYLFHLHTAMANKTCYLQDLFVDERFRGKGIANNLILEVSNRAKESGSTQIYWMTHESNQIARSLYDKIGKHSGFIVYSKRT